MFNFEEKLKELETVKEAEEIGNIVSMISKQFKEIYGEDILDKDVIRLIYYANAYHKSTRSIEGTPIPVLGVTRSGKSTFINSALGCKVLRSTRGQNTIQFENPITAVGDNFLSSTIYAECLSAPQKSEYCYIDTAGFLDTRGQVSTGITEYLGGKEFITNLSNLSLEICVSKALSSHQENGMPALIVLVNYSELTGGASQSLAFVKSLYSLLGRNEALSDRLIFVVTHADSRRAELSAEYDDAIAEGDIKLQKQEKNGWVRSFIISDIKAKYEATISAMREANKFISVLRNPAPKAMDDTPSSAIGVEAHGSDSSQQKGLTVEEMAWFISLLNKSSTLQQIVIANFKKGHETKEAVEAIIGRISKKHGSGIGPDWFNFKSTYGQKEHVQYFSTLLEALIQKSLKLVYEFNQVDSEYNDYATLRDNLENQVMGREEYVSYMREVNLNKIKAGMGLLQKEKHYLKSRIAELDTEEPFEEHVFRELTQYIVLGNTRLNDIKRSCAVPGCFLYRNENNKEQLALINSQRLVVAQVDLSGLGAKLNDLYWPSLEEYVEVTGDLNRLPQEIRDEVVAKYKKILSKATGTSELLQNPFKEGEPVRFYILYGTYPSGSNKPSIQYSDPGFYIYHTADGKIMVNILHISLPHGIPSVFELSSVNHTRGNPKIPLPRLNRPQKNIFPQSLPEFVMDYAVRFLGKKEHDRVYEALLGRNMPPLKEISGKRKHYRPCASENYKDTRIPVLGALTWSKHRIDLETPHKTIDASATINEGDTYDLSLYIKSGVTFHLLHSKNQNTLDARNLYLIKEDSGKGSAYFLGVAMDLSSSCTSSTLMKIPFRDKLILSILDKITEFNKLGQNNTPKIILDGSILGEFLNSKFQDIVTRLKELMQNSSKYVARYESDLGIDGYAEVYLYAQRNELPHVVQEIKAKKTRMDAIDIEMDALEKQRQLWSAGSSPVIDVLSRRENNKILTDRLGILNNKKYLLLKTLELFHPILEPFANIYELLDISPNDNSRIHEFIRASNELRNRFKEIMPQARPVIVTPKLSPKDNRSRNEDAKLPPRGNTSPDEDIKQPPHDTSWYDDTKLLSLLNAAVGRENPTIDVLTTVPDNTDRFKEIIRGYLQGIDGNSVINKLFIPINLNGDHWVLITVARDARDILYFDPFGKPIPERWKTALESSGFFTDFTLRNAKLALQEDGHSCGPWVVEFAKKIIQGDDVNKKEEFENIDIVVVRNQHNETLSRLSTASPGNIPTPPPLPEMAFTKDPKKDPAKDPKKQKQLFTPSGINLLQEIIKVATEIRERKLKAEEFKPQVQVVLLESENEEEEVNLRYNKWNKKDTILFQGKESREFFIFIRYDARKEYHGPLSELENLHRDAVGYLVNELGKMPISLAPSALEAKIRMREAAIDGKRLLIKPYELTKNNEVRNKLQETIGIVAESLKTQRQGFENNIEDAEQNTNLNSSPRAHFCFFSSSGEGPHHSSSTSSNEDRKEMELRKK